MFMIAAADDIPAIVALLNRAYRGTGPIGSWCSEHAYIKGDRATETLLRGEIAANPAASLLKWEDDASGQLNGCVWLRPIGGGIWYLGSFAVEPGRQNGGLGRAMLEAAESWVRDRGGSGIRMTVINVRDTLIAWYERRGYVRTGEIEPFAYEDDRVGTPLRDDLCFVVLAKALKTT